ncbi:MAG: DHH family phosphoesterase, partial [Campylobacter sp.]|nr:DHH family phosphoesterase [Campylobacter sp.]
MLGKKEIREILESRFSKDIHTKLSEIPLPKDLKDTYKAAARIKTAIENNEQIAIVGDYDVDGIVSSVVISDFFDELGVDYVVKIPNRFTDGYGLNPEILNELDGVSLIITVDNGISANEAAEICKAKGIDLIITDHHMPPPVLPNAYAIINPKQEDCTFPNVEICGAEVAWYLIGALKETLKINYDMSDVLDILIIAIIADMMELRDLNRVLVKFGIKKLNSSKRACFKAIKEHYFKKSFEFDDISYLIAPLINSTGRMDDATISYKFLCSKNIREANHYL